jgi:hypothetical protein
MKCCPTPPSIPSGGARTSSMRRSGASRSKTWPRTATSLRFRRRKPFSLPSLSLSGAWWSLVMCAWCYKGCRAVYIVRWRGGYLATVSRFPWPTRMLSPAVCARFVETESARSGIVLTEMVHQPAKKERCMRAGVREAEQRGGWHMALPVGQRGTTCVW